MSKLYDYLLNKRGLKIAERDKINDDIAELDNLMKEAYLAASEQCDCCTINRVIPPRLTCGRCDNFQELAERI
jgi:hypothetical protein